MILRNLITNAIRYTHTGGLLVACRTRGKDSLSIEVWDTGIGVAKEKIEDMFREFNQIENPERDSRKGFGLGLAIAQGLAKTLDSKITVGSIPDNGSVFRFKLPRSEVDLINDLPIAKQDFSFKGSRIIIINDVQNGRDAMLQLLNGWGCQCFSGESAEEVLTAIKNSELSSRLSAGRLSSTQWVYRQTSN